MNKMLIVAVVVIALIAAGVGAGAYFMMKQQPAATTSQTPSQNTTPQVSPENQVQKKSFKDLMGLTTNQKCTFKDTTTQNSGTVYASSGKARGDFSMVTDNKSVSSHMVSDGEYMYMWMDGQTKGFKTSLDAMQGVTITPQPQQGAVDINAQIDFDCTSWTPDTSMFTPPTTVKFEDYSKMMKDMQKVSTGSGSVRGTQDVKTTQCAACDSLPSDAQAQCRAALKC